MTVSVIVPWRATPDREPAWAMLRRRWAAAHPDWQLVEGACPDGEWRKAAAVVDGLTRAVGDVLVVTDADVWCDDVALAVAAVESGPHLWAVPHHRVVRLTAAATADVLAAGQLPPAVLTSSCAQRPYPGQLAGGIVVMRRETYRQVPIDPRYTGWGQEDESWSMALHCLVGRPWRGTADLWHLWHEPAARLDRARGSDAGLRLHRRYSDAARTPAAMAALLAEVTG